VGRPLGALSWGFDKLLYGWGVSATPIVQPFYVISAPRSGSSSMGKILGVDDTWDAVAWGFQMMPYLWVWRLLGATLGNFITTAQVEQFIDRKRPPEFKARHPDASIFRADTFDVAMAFAQHWGFNGALLALINGWPHWMDDLTPYEQERALDYQDAISKKWLYYCGSAASGKRLLLKSHLICMVPAMAKRHPTAAFATVCRDPEEIIASAIPYYNVLPVVPIGEPGWNDSPELADKMIRYVAEYTQRELAEYRALQVSDKARATLIPFKSFKSDIHKELERLYSLLSAFYASPAGQAHPAAASYRPLRQYRGSNFEAALVKQMAKGYGKKHDGAKYPNAKMDVVLSRPGSSFTRESFNAIFAEYLETIDRETEANQKRDAEATQAAATIAAERERGG